MRYVSLFSGIEAASAAWEALGWEPVCFAELDAFPSAVLACRYPNVPNKGDVTKVDWRKMRGCCDLVVGGSPCQSFSIAGKREGLKGESGLMYEYIRAVRELRPRWFLWENVPGALTSEHGEAFRQLLSEMDALGYGMAWRVLDAQFFGVAQRRERVFLVGRLGAKPPAEVLFDGERLQWDFAQGREKRAELAAAARRSPESAGEFQPSVHTECAIQGSMINRSNHAGPQGSGIETDGASYTLNCTDRHGVLQVCNSNGQDLVGALCARDSKGVGTQYVNEGKVIAFAQNGRDELRVQGDGTLSGALSASPGMKQTTYIADVPVTMADANARAAVMEDACGTLHVGGDAPAMAQRSVVRRLTPMECERLQGFPDNWTRIPYRGKPAEECPDTPRYKAIGNSMAVPVMRWIGERIALAEEGRIQ